MTSHRNWRFVRNGICFTEELPTISSGSLDRETIHQTIYLALMLYQSLFMLCIPGSMSQSHAFWSHPPLTVIIGRLSSGLIHISKMVGSMPQFVCISSCVQIKKSWPHSWPQYISTDWSPAPRTTLFPGPDIRRSPKYPRHTHLDNNGSAHWNIWAGVKTLFFVSVITAVGRNPLCWKEEYYYKMLPCRASTPPPQESTQF